MVDFLGVCVGVTRAPHTASLPEDKRRAYCELVSGILRAGWCKPRLAAELAGKLSFSVSMVWGRGLRVYTKYIYRQSTGSSSVIGDGLREALRFWVVFSAKPIVSHLPLRGEQNRGVTPY